MTERSCDSESCKRRRLENRAEIKYELPIHLTEKIALLSTLGADVRGWSAVEVANMDSASEELMDLASALSTHSLLIFHGASRSPSDLRALYTKLHKAMGIGCALPTKKVPVSSANGSLRGACFPGFPETNILGCFSELKDWHGLSGSLQPAAWWEEENCQFHHDGGFSAKSPPPPAIVAMYCEETPSTGASTLTWDNGAELPYAAGATLFYSTRVALQLASSAMVERARAMTCHYHQGFGQVKRGVYPVMSSTGLVPSVSATQANLDHRNVTDAEFMSFESYAFDGASPSEADCSALYGSDKCGARFFRHALVQHDRHGEFILVHAVCLDHLEEEGHGSLTWEESMAFIENLLAPAARPPHLLALGWQPGDVAVFDNRCLQHSVTPTHRHGHDSGYVVLGERRIMTRTAMQPTWLPCVD